MNVITFPAPQARIHVTEAPEVTDAVLHELLRKALAAHRSGIIRVPGSLSHRHHLALSHAFLDSIEIVMGVCGLARELAQSLDMGITDVRKLARIARNFGGPWSA